MSIYVAIAGVAWAVRPEDGSVSVQQSVDERNTAQVTLVSSGDQPLVGAQVEIGDDTRVFFAGTIDAISITPNRPASLIYIRCACVSFDQIATRRRVTTRHSWVSTAAGTCISELASAYLNAGDECGTGGVEAGPAISIEIEPGVSVYEAFDAIAAAAGTYWDILGMSGAPQLRHFARTSHPSPVSITAGSTGVMRRYGVTSDRRDMVNRVWVRLPGQPGEEVSQTLHGNGAARRFELAQPMASAPRIELNGVTQAVGVESSADAAQWYWPGASGAAQIEQDAGEAVLVAGDDLVVTYTPLVTEVRLLATDAASVSATATREALSGRYETLIEVADGIAIGEAEAVAAAALAGTPSRQLDLELRGEQWYPLEVGQLLTVNRSEFGASGTYFVERCSRDLIARELRTRIVCSSGKVQPDWISTLASAWRGSGFGGGSAIAAGSGLRYQPVTLTGDTEIGFADPVEGQQLVVRIEQDATGGRQITWAAVFGGSPTVDIATEPGAVTVMQFVGHSDGKWWQSAVAR